MEKPWMDSLMEVLQPMLAKDQAPEQPSTHPKEQSVFPERQSIPVPEPANFAEIFDSCRAASSRSPLEYEGSTYGNETWSDRFWGHAAAITLALLFVTALGALCFFYRTQLGQSLVRLGEKVSGESTQDSGIRTLKINTSMAEPSLASLPTASRDQSVANAEIPTSAPVASFNRPTVSRNPHTNDADSLASRSSLRWPVVGRPAPDASGIVDDGQAEFRFARTSLSEARTHEAKVRAAELLWAAVSKGSSDAEIELADMYGRGDGVRKNCEQARILLAAARDRDNSLAGREFSELRVYGCR